MIRYFGISMPLFHTHILKVYVEWMIWKTNNVHWLQGMLMSHIAPVTTLPPRYLLTYLGMFNLLFIWPKNSIWCKAINHFSLFPPSHFKRLRYFVLLITASVYCDKISTSMALEISNIEFWILMCLNKWRLNRNRDLTVLKISISHTLDGILVS